MWEVTRVPGETPSSRRRGVTRLVDVTRVMVFLPTFLSGVNILLEDTR
jgi:hypothetical protein